MKKKVAKLNKNNLVIYQAKSGAIELRGDFQDETMWATQAQMADIFGVKRPAITKHINNILKDKELDARSVCSILEHTAKDGKTYKVQYYSLDVILSVGYRTNSNRAIEFRKWATKTLREHITKGYTINRAVASRNYDSFMEAVSKVKALLPKGSAIDSSDILELINLFAYTWLSLDAYDKDKLSGNGATRKSVALTAGAIWKDISILKNTLIGKDEATELFATEREKNSLEGIIGNVMQSFGGKELYPTIEEKAAHLLYFIIKNHPFVDGNKRTGAYAFIWYLNKAKILDVKKLSPQALTAVTILIAESNPAHKDKMTALVVELLKVGK